MRITLLFTVAICLIAPGLSPASPLTPPGGPAPTALTGTWRTTLTPAELRQLAAPGGQRIWELVVVNSKYQTYPHALGFGPANSGRDTVPFGVSAHRLYLACLDKQGNPTSGHGTYTWSIRGNALRFKLVREPCRDPFLRDRIILLTSEPWRRA